MVAKWKRLASCAPDWVASAWRAHLDPRGPRLVMHPRPKDGKAIACRRRSLPSCRVLSSPFCRPLSGPRHLTFHSSRHMFLAANDLRKEGHQVLPLRNPIIVNHTPENPEKVASRGRKIPTHQEASSDPPNQILEATRHHSSIRGQKSKWLQGR